MIPRLHLSRGSGWLSCRILAIALFLPASALRAQELHLRSFDLPAGSADKTLKLFSEQSGRGLIATTEEVKSVRTNAVAGEFAPREALDKMLLGTGLVAEQDEKSGAFVVHPGPNGPNAEGTALAPPRVVPLDQANPAQNEESRPIVLSPFEVNTTADHGFASSQTFSGGRLATPLADTAAPYQVMNQQVIQALGITELRDALDWATNSYIETHWQGGGYYINIPLNNTTRGGGTPDNFRQSNFFQYFGPNDSYNIERYDVGRGGNAVLFGLGQLGATTIAQFKQAQTDQPFEGADLLTGSYNRIRATIDVNRPVNEKLAVRVAGVYDKGDGWRDNDFKFTRAAFAAIKYRPFKNTEIRINAERGQQDVLQSWAVLSDYFAGWDGKTVFNGALTNAQLSGTAPSASGTVLVNNGNNQGVSRLGGNYFVYNPYSAAGAIMSYTNQAITMSGGATPTTPIAGYTYANAGGVSFGTFGVPTVGALPIIGAFDVPGNRFATAAANSAWRMPSQQFDNEVATPTAILSFNYLDLSIDQHVGDSLFFQAAGTANHTANWITNLPSAMQNTYIDIDQTLPNGAHNPNFLQPYSESDQGFRNSNHGNNNFAMRFAAAYVHDFGKWGSYAVNTIVGDSENYTSNRTYVLSIEQNADPRQWAVSDIIHMRQYWYDPNHSHAAPGVPVSFVNPFTGTNETITPQWVGQDFGVTPTDSIRHDAYGLLAVNAKYLKGRLVFQAALRDDITSVSTRYAINEGEYPANWNTSQIIWRPNAPANWNTLTYYPKTAAGAISGPATNAITRPTTTVNGIAVPQAQYAGDVFQDDFNPPTLNTSKGLTKSLASVMHLTSWWSLTGDIASSFTPNTSPTPRVDGSNLPNIISRGFDLGTRFSLPNDRLSVGYTHYWNYSSGRNTVPNNLTGPVNGILGAQPVGDANSTDRNSLGLPNLITGGNDTTDQLALGDEIEVTANLAPGWRLFGNWSFPYFSNLNQDPVTLGFIQAHQQDFITILKDAGGALDTTQHPNGAPGLATAPALPPGTVALGQINAVNNYNSLYQAVAGTTAGKTLVNYAVVLNLFTDYTIPTGFLKGVDVGLGDQYRGRHIVGSTAANTIPNPANPATTLPAPNASPFNYVKVGGYNTVTGTLGYHWRFYGRNIFFNLRLVNLLNNRGIIYTTGVAMLPYNGDYTSAARTATPVQLGQLRAPMSWTLEASTKF